jgi:hypothetical protein
MLNTCTKINLLAQYIDSKYVNKMYFQCCCLNEINSSPENRIGGVGNKKLHLNVITGTSYSMERQVFLADGNRCQQSREAELRP